MSDDAVVETASGLGYVDLVDGQGPRPAAGDSVRVHYTGLAQGRNEVRQLPRPRAAVRVRHRPRPRDPRLGRGRGVDEGGRQAQAHHPRAPGVRRARGRRSDPARRHAHLRGRAARHHRERLNATGGTAGAIRRIYLGAGASACCNPAQETTRFPPVSRGTRRRPMSRLIALAVALLFATGRRRAARRVGPGPEGRARRRPRAAKPAEKADKKAEEKKAPARHQHRLGGRAEDAAGHRRRLRQEDRRGPALQGQGRARAEEDRAQGDVRQDQGHDHRQAEIASPTAAAASRSAAPAGSIAIARAVALHGAHRASVAGGTGSPTGAPTAAARWLTPESPPR